MRDGYRGYQIALHWVIAGVLPVQYDRTDPSCSAHGRTAVTRRYTAAPGPQLRGDSHRWARRIASLSTRRHTNIGSKHDAEKES